MSKPWVGVDLDGTLAYHDWDTEGIGDPIPEMVARVKFWLDKGVTVKIFTARAAGLFVRKDAVRTQEFDIDCARAASWEAQIKKWCLEHIGQELEVTAVKDYYMIELWDDRAIGVVANTGKVK